MNAGGSILPGGRIVAPAGDQYLTGPDTFGLAVSASGKVLATASAGQHDSTPMVMERQSNGRWEPIQLERGLDLPAEFDASDWRGIARGLVFSGEHAVFASEGASGRISLIDWNAGRVRTIDLNQGGATGSYAGDLALDAPSGLLYAADPGNSRVAVIEARSRQAIAWAALAGPPLALALSPDRRKLYAAVGGEAGSLAVLDVADPSAPKVEATVATGGADSSGVIAADGKVFVANGGGDSITAIDAATNRVEAEIPIRIPGLEQLRGVRPAGMAYHERSGLLLVAEAGINAVAVIDVRERRVLGHIPVGWFPTRVVIDRDTVLVANAKGQGANAPFGDIRWRQGSLSVFPAPTVEELPARTAFVMQANGFEPRAGGPQALAAGVRYVVLIVKEGRTYDETLGDIPGASNGPAMGIPGLARFGMRGYVDGRRVRLSIKDVAVTPNQHAIASQWTFGDNFYADSPSWPAAPGIRGGAGGRRWRLSAAARAPTPAYRTRTGPRSLLARLRSGMSRPARICRGCSSSACPTTAWRPRARAMATPTRNRSSRTTTWRWDASWSSSPARSGGGKWRYSRRRTERGAGWTTSTRGGRCCYARGRGRNAIT
jgi:YVTN family beta-propeller protein